MNHPAARPSSPLIGAEELRERLGDVRILDVRYRMGGPGGPDVFAQGHVPGSVYVDLDADLAAAPGAGGRHPLPEVEQFAAAMRRAGVRSGQGVVVLDDWQGRAAARAWWLLRHHGHPDVRVLDGGWAAWLESGGPVGTGPGAGPQAGDFAASGPHTPSVEADEVPGVAVLIDARAPERYRGEVEPVDAVAGHIPGALNLPTDANLAADGRFRPAAQLRERYAAVGAVPGADVAVYCGSGVTAAHDLLALEVAGVRAALYPGSWSGWITDRARPVARG